MSTRRLSTISPIMGLVAISRSKPNEQETPFLKLWLAQLSLGQRLNCGAGVTSELVSSILLLCVAKFVIAPHMHDGVHPEKHYVRPTFRIKNIQTPGIEQDL